MKKIVILSALSLGILFLAGCGQQPVSQTQPIAPAPVTQKSLDNQPVETQKTDETAGWQTYLSAKYGIGFKYPKDYTVREGALDEYHSNMIIVENKQNNTAYVMEFFDNPLNLTPAEYVDNLNKKKNEPEALFYASLKKVIVNGVEGIDTNAGGPGDKARNVFFLVKNKIINISYSLNNDFSGDQITYDNYLKNGDVLISTLKLTK